MSGKPATRNRLRAMWAAPCAIAAFTLAGLVTALLSDSAGARMFACAGLTVPVGVMAWYLAATFRAPTRD